METKKPLFRELTAEDPEPETTEIESLCMNCQKNGVTRLLLTKIPFFKDVIVMSFCCEHCGFQNNEIQSGSKVDEKGVKITLKVQTERDLCRQVVKSDYASIKIVELDFEIPGKSQKGEVTTVEGIINRCVTGLQQDQPLRRVQHPEVASQIDEVILKLEHLKELEKPFTLIIEDISGNSFIQNPNVPHPDLQCTTTYFKRNKEQDHELGIFTNDEIEDGAKQQEEPNLLHPITEGEYKYEDLLGEVLQFPTNCNICGAPCQTNMKVTDIPHFKQVVIMATTCDTCGNRTNEVKSGGGIEPKGVKIEVNVYSKDDFSRDLLKSETCHLFIPQLDLEVGPVALGGRFTTVEGILVAIKDQLGEHMFGDSTEEETKRRLERFIEQFDDILECRRPITIILDDPAGNSYIQSLADNGKPDSNLKITHYQRSFEQNEELGLNDLKTENYES
ncbi:zinc finger protein ZPR1 [Agrilus planipennis]|uniref:Zinc finger protein ZPR1 n=1 Tax=Agrilus planipennis TaxID=224129 RepID=A0A1W4WID0_AGRPL|nr:zinc finger protein ZPR1 [Agrilus planipennis]